MLRGIRRLFDARQRGHDLSEEIRQHLEEKIDALIEGGVSREEAVSRARREFGNVTLIEERSGEVWRWSFLDQLVSDVQYAFRQIRKSPAFVVAAVLTLAVGIGANTAVFSVINAVVLRPLPFSEPDRLVSVLDLRTRGTPTPDNVSYPDFFDFRKYNHVFEHLVCYHDDEITLTGLTQPLHLDAEMVSWDLFPLLKVYPVPGRGFARDEEKPGARVVVISYELWQRHFGGDRGVVGRSVTLDSEPYTIVGIAPAGFRFPIQNQAVQLWTTIARDASPGTRTPVTAQRGSRMLDVIGRLRPGVTLDQARAQMDGIASALAKQYGGSNTNYTRTYIQPELDKLIGDTRGPLMILMGAVGLVLLIACANVANLLLARTSERAREFAVRAAIGASRIRVVRQLLTESFVLALIGSIGGLLLALVCLRLMLPLAAESIPRLAQASIDGPVLAFCIALASLTTALFSIAPAVQIAGADLTGALKEGTRSIAGGNERIRSLLIVGQITLGLVLLSGAGLLIASFVHLARRDPGFRADHVLTFCLSLPDAQYNEAKRISFYDTVLERLKAMPGVESAGIGWPLPLSGEQAVVAFDIQERPAPGPNRPHADIAIVTPGYFKALGIPLLQGRDFTDRDDLKSVPALVVNKAFADRFFPGETVIGKQISPGTVSRLRGEEMHEVVGVVGNARQSALNSDPEPIYYFPYKQLPWPITLSVALRTSIPPRDVESAARVVIASIDKQVPIYQIRTMEDYLSIGIAQPRFHMLLLGNFAGIALLLTVIGLYGVMAYSVMKRTREIGVRIAMGANRRMVLSMVLKQAMVLVMVGLVIGLTGAFASGRLLQKMLYGLSPRNPFPLLVACCVIVLTAAIAAYLPARRAASIDPIQALRSE